MFEDLRKNVADTTDEDAVRAYLLRLLRREAFDQKGLIYGMGHAVYSLSDPRARIFKNFVAALAEEKGRTDDYKLYEMVERLAPKVIADERKIYKGVSANVDFYSGFVYSMLGLPLELYTPMFAIARASAGAPTAWRSSLTPTRSSAPPIKASWSRCRTARWANGNAPPLPQAAPCTSRAPGLPAQTAPAVSEKCGHFVNGCRSRKQTAH